MTGYLADDRLRAFGQPARVTVWPDRDSVLCMGDAEVLLRIVERDGWFVVEKQDRGGAWYRQMTSEWLEVARRYLLWEIGGWVQSAAGRQPVRSSPDEPLRDGFTLTDQGPAGPVLHWIEPAGSRSVSFPSARWISTAKRFASFADLPEGAIVDRLGSVRTPPSGVPPTAVPAGAPQPGAGDPVGVGGDPADVEDERRQRRLVDWGIELFRRIAPDIELGHRLLPEDDAVVVFHRGRGGGSIYVAADESVLFMASAVPPHEAVEMFRSGLRTPVERFVDRRRSPADQG